MWIFYQSIFQHSLRMFALYTLLQLCLLLPTFVFHCNLLYLQIKQIKHTTNKAKDQCLSVMQAFAPLVQLGQQLTSEIMSNSEENKMQRQRKYSTFSTVVVSGSVQGWLFGQKVKQHQGSVYSSTGLCCSTRCMPDVGTPTQSESFLIVIAQVYNEIVAATEYDKGTQAG